METRMIRVRFTCGHEGTASLNIDSLPRCFCGETQIARTFARAPHVRDSGTWSYAGYKPVKPGVVTPTNTPLVSKQTDRR
jgi:hypothetical protein